METTATLYDLLGVDKAATPADIKKAFRTMSLQVHPDKHSQADKQQAEHNFTKLKQAYEILISPEKRRLYDLTGDLEDVAGFFEAYEYYREVYHRVSFEDIDSFASSYKGSAAEEEDLTNFYLDFGGDMTLILQYVPLSEASDLPRFFAVYDRLIKAKQLPKKKVYRQSKEAVKLIDEEGEDIGQDKASHRPRGALMNSFDDLASMIQNRGQARRDFLDDLEAKYSRPKKQAKLRS
jgi:DnaJ family protein C protein 9